MELNILKVVLITLSVATHHQFLQQVSAVEPITTGLAVGTAVTVSALLAGYDFIKCQQWECCNDIWIKPNISGMTIQAIQANI